MTDGAVLAAALVAALAGLARGFSGFGAALIFIPLGSALLGPRVAAPLLMLVDNVLAAPLIPAAWRQASRTCSSAEAPVEMMTLIFGLILRSSWKHFWPPMPGMMRSRITRSMRSFCWR